jgi:hypothetical protein
LAPEWPVRLEGLRMKVVGWEIQGNCRPALVNCQSVAGQNNMENAIHIVKTYEYRLTFLQSLFNRSGILIMAIVTLAIGGYCTYYSIVSPQVNYAALWLAVVAFALLVILCFVLFFGYNRWTGTVKSLEFAELGIKGVGPYQFLRVERGLMKTSVIRSITGHFIIVPNTVISKSELNQIIDAKKLKK